MEYLQELRELLPAFPFFGTKTTVVGSALSNLKREMYWRRKTTLTRYGTPKKAIHFRNMIKFPM